MTIKKANEYLAGMAARGFVPDDETAQRALHAEEDEDERMEREYDEACEREQLQAEGRLPCDTPTVANCDDWGTGEGRYHGRM